MAEPMVIDENLDIDAMDTGGSSGLYVDIIWSYYRIPFSYLYQPISSHEPTVNGARLTPLLNKIDRFNTKHGWQTLFDKPLDHSMTLLLILPYSIIIDVESRIEYETQLTGGTFPNSLANSLYSEVFAKNLKGYALIKPYNFPGKVIYGIFNFCKNPDLESSSGKILFSAVHNYLTNLTKQDKVDYYYWLQIDYYNSDIPRDRVSKLIALYSSFGFENPYISKRTPDNIELDRPYLCLFKKSTEPIATKVEVKQICRQSHYLMHNSYLSESYTMFPVTVALEKDLQLYLQSLIYCNLDTKLFTDSDKFNFELCGNMDYERIVKLENLGSRQDNYVLNMVIKNYGNSIREKPGSYSVSSYSNCAIGIDSSYIFHTHPLSWYITTGASLATPSTADVLFFIRQHISYPVRSICQFVVTLEGIYTISLSKPLNINTILEKTNMSYVVYDQSGVGQTTPGSQLLANTLLKVFEYPVEYRTFKWYDNGPISITKKISEINKQVTTDNRDYYDYIENTRKRYSDHLRRFNDMTWLADIIDSVQIVLHSWSDLAHSGLITIYSPVIGYNSCLNYTDLQAVRDAIPNV